MEEYTNNPNPNQNQNQTSRPNFLYNQIPMNNNSFHLQSRGSENCFQSEQVHQHHQQSAVKTESNSTSQLHTPIFHYPNLMRTNIIPQTIMNHHQQSGGGGSPSSSNEAEAIKAKIIAHPQYSSLLQAYMDCQKVSIINHYYFFII